MCGPTGSAPVTISNLPLSSVHKPRPGRGLPRTAGPTPPTRSHTVHRDTRRHAGLDDGRHRGPYVVILVAVNNWISVDVRRAGAGTRGGRPDGVEDLAVGGRQAGRGDRRDLDVLDEVDPGNHRVAHPRPQDRVAGRRRGRSGDGRDLRLPAFPATPAGAERGPDSAPTADESDAPQSAPVDAVTRAVNVDALSPCSAVQIQYVSIALT